MISLHDILAEISVRQAHLPRGDQAVVAVYDWQLDRATFPEPVRVRGLDRTQLEDLRYELSDRRSLHEQIFADGRSEFHIDEGHPASIGGVVRHTLKDTKAPLGTALGYGAALIVGGPAWLLAGLGGLIGSRMARRRLTRRNP